MWTALSGATRLQSGCFFTTVGRKELPGRLTLPRAGVGGWLLGDETTVFQWEPIRSVGFSSSWVLLSDALTRRADVLQDLTAHVSFPISHTGNPNILSPPQGVFAMLPKAIILPVALFLFFRHTRPYIKTKHNNSIRKCHAADTRPLES